MYNFYSDLLLYSMQVLKDCLSLNSRLESEVLLSIVLNMDRYKLVLIQDEVSNYKELKRFMTFVERRSQHEPVAYLKEEKEFYSLPIYVNRNVLIPRNESELIPEYFTSKNIDRQSVLELCSGSGCIGLSIALIYQKLSILNADIECNALKVESKNVRLQGIHTIKLFVSDMFLGIPFDLFDFILCNPPYIKDSDVLVLMEDVRCFEPLSALGGGKDGLLYYKYLADHSTAYLKPSGELLVEIGLGQSKKVENIFVSKGFYLKKIMVDLSGIERTMVFGIK